MIQRLRQLCHEDERIVAAMLYGSFTYGEADEFSDIDCFLFFEDDALPEIDHQAWVSQVAPVELFYVNQFGNRTAIFDNLVRAEFHFDKASDMRQIDGWKGKVWFPSLASTVLVDRTGSLAEHLQPIIGSPPSHDSPEDLSNLCYGFINWFLLGSNLMARGEYSHALELLLMVQDDLLRMARLLEGAAHRWINPTKFLEQEISAQAYERYRACTASLDSRALWGAYLAAWRWGSEMMTAHAERCNTTLPDTLISKVGRRIEAYYPNT
jgi:lincosamide nucleotidyltransferase